MHRYIYRKGFRTKRYYYTRCNTPKRVTGTSLCDITPWQHSCHTTVNVKRWRNVVVQTDLASLIFELRPPALEVYV